MKQKVICRAGIFRVAQASLPQLSGQPFSATGKKHGGNEINLKTVV
ncbi:MAG: hypothetical protein ABIJ04_08020 [Bacteroidota bacterium]